MKGLLGKKAQANSLAWLMPLEPLPSARVKSNINRQERDIDSAFYTAFAILAESNSPTQLIANAV